MSTRSSYFQSSFYIFLAMNIRKVNIISIYFAVKDLKEVDSYRIKFSYTIKRARLRIERYYESLIQGNSVAGPIFALKNLGWVDSQSIDHTSKGEKVGPLQVIVDTSETAETLKKLRDGSKAD